jgi:hypothetical protein
MTTQQNKPWLREDGSCAFCDDFGSAKVIGPKGEQIVECPHKNDPDHKKVEQ